MGYGARELDNVSFGCANGFVTDELVAEWTNELVRNRAALSTNSEPELIPGNGHLIDRAQDSSSHTGLPKFDCGSPNYSVPLLVLGWVRGGGGGRGGGVSNQPPFRGCEGTLQMYLGVHGRLQPLSAVLTTHVLPARKDELGSL